MFVLDHYSNCLKSGGILITEDIQSDTDLAGLIRAVPREWAYEVFDLRSIKGRYDDLILVVRKP